MSINAEVTISSAPQEVDLKKPFGARFRIHNQSNITFQPGIHRLGSQPENYSQWGVTRIDIDHPIPPSGSLDFTYDQLEAQQPGEYPFSWRMVTVADEWFGTPSETVMISVSMPKYHPPHPDRDPLLLYAIRHRSNIGGIGGIGGGPRRYLNLRNNIWETILILDCIDSDRDILINRNAQCEIPGDIDVVLVELVNNIWIEKTK